jgi:serine/threonine protein kinase
MSESNPNTDFVAPDATDLAPHFSAYEIQGLIASGGMGAVYCAVQKSLDRTVAIKILPVEFGKDEVFRAAFEAEAKAMARLNHPNLIGVYDFGEVNGMLYIVMEFVPGKSLYHSAYGVAIDPSEVVRLVSCICHGLAHAHENGIIHRDIKPSNILLDLNAQPKIGDFGLARPVELKVDDTNEIFGTPHYTAPEVVADPHSVDFRADIFSVGVLLHELLTGKLPAVDPRSASVISHCDPRFDAIVSRATQPSPANRYASATELASDLLQLGQALEARAPKAVRTVVPRAVTPLPRNFQVKHKRNSNVPSIIKILAVMSLMTVVLYYFSTKRPEVPTPKVSIPEVSTPEVLTPEVSTPLEAPVEAPAEVELTEIPKLQQPLADSSPFDTQVVEPPPEEESPPSDLQQPQPAPVEPKSDVPAFLRLARDKMWLLAKPVMKKYSADLMGNVLGAKRDLERALRKENYYRDSAEKLVQSEFEDWQKAGNRIPSSYSEYLAEFPKIREEFLKKQEDFDTAYQQDLSKISGDYIRGIEMQIERLKVTNDEGSVILLKKEVERTRKSLKYFENLMFQFDPKATE